MCNPKFILGLLTAAALTVTGSIAASAQQTAAEANHVNLGAEKQIANYLDIQVRNFQDEALGRVVDVGLDLVNGRIVEVFVKSDPDLKAGSRVVALPPLALIADPVNGVYRITVSTDAFREAPAVDLSHWKDYGQSDRLAAVYESFGETPYFLVGDEAGHGTRPKIELGYVERASKILDLPVGNTVGDPFGKINSLTLDIPRGRILNAIVLAPGNFKTKSIIPAMALRFNDARNALILDDTRLEYANEPRYVLTDAAYGQKAYSREEPYEGPHTLVALSQGTAYRDIDRTIRIVREIRGVGQLRDRRIQVGTLNDRVTLRGTVTTAEDKNRIAQIAIANSRPELVDNQIVVQTAQR